MHCKKQKCVKHTDLSTEYVLVCVLGTCFCFYSVGALNITWILTVKCGSVCMECLQWLPCGEHSDKLLLYMVMNGKKSRPTYNQSNEFSN